MIAAHDMVHIPLHNGLNGAMLDFLRECLNERLFVNYLGKTWIDILLLFTINWSVSIYSILSAVLWIGGDCHEQKVLTIYRIY